MNTLQQSIADKTASTLHAAARNATDAADGFGRAVHPAMDALSSSVDQVRANAGPAMHELASDAQDMARTSAKVVSERALQLRDASASYVRGHPLQTVLLAAGVGAALALLVRMLTHRSHPSR